MALIKCPECGKEVSDKAKMCINCGCPLEEMSSTGIVRIKMPNNIVEGFVGLFSSRRAEVTDSFGKSLWVGQHGDNASFTVDGPTEATEMFHILKNAENPHFYGFRLHTFRTTDKVVRYGINNQFDFAEHPAVIQRGEKRTINICVAVPDVA